jgi:phenylalanyl-tRNA synthetase, alpha subunit
MDGSISLSRVQYDILDYLFRAPGSVTIDEMVEKLAIDQVFVSSTVQYLAETGLVTVIENEVTEIQLAAKIDLISPEELPERTILKVLAQEGAGLHLQELSVKVHTEQKVVGKSLKPMLDKGWIVKNGAMVSVTDNGKAALGNEGDDEKLFTVLRKTKSLIVEEVQSKLDFFARGYELLKKRGQFLNIKIRKRRNTTLTDKGKALLSAGKKITIKEEATSLTSELLQDGQWKNVTFKPYDIQADVEYLQAGKIHPFQRLLNQVRGIFYGMGFTEVSSPHVESSFWCFDALFQPQDHPARDMQDTFYVKQPSSAPLPESDLVEKVKATHENGGACGSKGWDYTWNVELAKKTVLRTHDTAASVRQLYKRPQAPGKYFCIGRVFRREAVDYRHLPVFTQVDGIIVEEGASLSHLIDILSEFYKRMGFSKIEIRPSFFPYTEPSLEVHVYLENRREWIEMGGAGVFRKEVTLPLGCTAPVLAWGLGLERLAMIKYDIDDLRKIYISNLKWLREVPTCR